jgi:hypothetical protein
VPKPRAMVDYRKCQLKCPILIRLFYSDSAIKWPPVGMNRINHAARREKAMTNKSICQKGTKALGELDFMKNFSP